MKLTWVNKNKKDQHTGNSVARCVQHVLNKHNGSGENINSY